MSAQRLSVDDVLLDIHSAVLAPERWHSAVSGIASLLGAERALHFGVPDRNGKYWVGSFNFDPQTLREYACEYVRKDIWCEAAIRARRTSAGLVSTGEQLVDRYEFLKSEFFNDFLKGYDIDRFMNVILRGPSSPEGPPTAMLSTFRGVGADAFTARDADLLQKLAPHIMLAAKNFSAAQSLSSSARVLDCALDSLSAGVFALGRNGQLCAANRMGEALLRQEDVVRAVGGQIVAGLRLRNPDAIDKLLSEAARGFSTCQRLETASAEGTSIAIAAPLAEREARHRTLPVESAALLWITHAAPGLMGPRFARLFLLTEAEAQLLDRFVEAEDLRLVAQMLRRSLHTVRAQMKAILRKTGRRSQAQLLALVARFAAVHGDARDVG